MTAQLDRQQLKRCGIEGTSQRGAQVLVWCLCMEGSQLQAWRQVQRRLQVHGGVSVHERKLSAGGSCVYEGGSTTRRGLSA